MKKENFYIQFLLHHGDNLLILSHRTSEWCGHSPNVELDIAITNIALDMLGQARNFYQLICELLDDNSTEDSLAYLRNADEFLNKNLVELPNKDFALTIARLFFVANYYYQLYEIISKNTSNDKLKALATKHLKETTYHLKWSREWLLRFYYGTEESLQKLLSACQSISSYTNDFLSKNAFDDDMSKHFNVEAALVNQQTITYYLQHFEQNEQVFLHLIQPDLLQTKQDTKTQHTIHLTSLLQEMQSVHREHPNAIW